MKIIPEDAIQYTFHQISEHYADEVARHSPTWIVPDDFEDHMEDFNSPEWHRAMIRLHVAFLETLFDKNGNMLLFRGMELRDKPKRSTRRDLGRHWTYSTDADLSGAQASSVDWFDTLIVTRAPFRNISWRETLLGHVMGSHLTEKEVFVDGPVKVLDVRPFSDLKKLGVTHDFDSWSRKNKKLWKKLLAEGTP